MLIDPKNTWSTLEQRLKVEKNSVYRAQLSRIIEHFQSEASGDLDGVLNTVSPNATYIVYESPEAPAHYIKGHDEIRAYYKQTFNIISESLEIRIDKLVVDDRCVVTEGTVRSGLRGHFLKAIGIAIDDVEAFYLSEASTVIVWPFDETGLLSGEHIYMGARMALEESAKRKLQPEDIGLYKRP